MTPCLQPKTGKAFFVVTTADGTVVFKGETSGPVSIPKGKTVVATFSYTPATAATARSPASERNQPVCQT